MSAVGLPEPIGVCKNPTCGTCIEAATPKQCLWCGWPADKEPTRAELLRLFKAGGTRMQRERRENHGFLKRQWP